MSHRITTSCDGCTACARQCPTGAIRGRRKELHVVDRSLCIDCGVCGMICAASAVRDELDRPAARIPRGRRHRPVIDADICNGCGLCVDYCPSLCLEVEGARFSGIAVLSMPLACVSCGECADICIKGAVTMRELDLRAHDPAAESARCRSILDDYLEEE